MKKAYNLFRIDDICDKMPNFKGVLQLIDLLNSYNIRPLLGIVPNVDDPIIMNNHSKFKLEDLKKLIKSNKIDIAIHGYNHKYISNKKGILKLNNTSEFSGLNYNIQERKIKEGLKILKKILGVTPKYFFAPAHNYDKNTLKVLKKYNLINVDGISLYPFYKGGVYHIPQQKRSLTPKFDLFKCGIFVNYFHPKDITNKKLLEINEFCFKNKSNLINFEDIKKIKFNCQKILNTLFIYLYYLKLGIYRFLHNA